MTYDPLAGVRINSCRPSYKPLHITTPITLNLPPCSPQDEPAFRVLRLRSERELQRVETCQNIFPDIADAMPRAQAHCLRHDEARKLGQDTSAIANECEVLYRELMHWLDVVLPQAGYPPLPEASAIDTNDFLQCRHVIHNLHLRMGIGFILSNILRPWLETSYPEFSAASQAPTSTTTVGRLQAACLDNARTFVSFIPVVNALLNTRQSSLITPFIAANMFNAATSFAIPVLRAVTHHPASPFGPPQPSRASVAPSAANPSGAPTREPSMSAGASPAGASVMGEGDGEDPYVSGAEHAVQRLPAWPTHLWRSGNMTRPAFKKPQTEPIESDANTPRSETKLPASIYADATVRECAEHILVVLDALSRLNANPLGQTAERKLEHLIQQYGLRESQSPQWSRLQTAANPATNVPVDDLEFLHELLQMQPSIWEGLFEAGALTTNPAQQPAPSTSLQ